MLVQPDRPTHPSTQYYVDNHGGSIKIYNVGSGTITTDCVISTQSDYFNMNCDDYNYIIAEMSCMLLYQCLDR